MKRAKHTGTNHVACPACITYAEQNRFPWEHDYLTVMARKGYGGKQLHDAAIALQAKAEAYRSMGMVKVKGALGGTYWE